MCVNITRTDLYVCIIEGEEPGTTTEAPATSTTPNLLDDSVNLYALVVNEQVFVNESLDDILGEIEDMANRFSANDSCVLDRSPPVTCRAECQLGLEMDRGCVRITLSVEKSIYCNYNNEMLR
jgi:hypothetical protein